MRMRWILTSLLLPLLVLSGCTLLQDMFGNNQADLTVKSVEMLLDANGNPTGIRTVLANTGGTDVSSVEYLVCLSTDTTINNVDGVVYVAAVSSAALVHRSNLWLDTTNQSIVAAVQSWPGTRTGPTAIPRWPGDTPYSITPFAGGYLNIIAFVDTNNDGGLSFDANGNPTEPAVGWNPTQSAQWFDSTLSSWTGPSLYNF